MELVKILDLKCLVKRAPDDLIYVTTCTMLIILWKKKINVKSLNFLILNTDESMIEQNNLERLPHRKIS